MAEMEQIFKAMSDGLKALSLAIAGIAEKVEQMAGQEKEGKTAAKPKARSKAKAKTKTKAAAKKTTTRKKAAAKAKGAAKKPRKTAKTAKAGRKPKKQTALLELNDLIAKYPDGVDTGELKNQSGFDEKKIHNIVYKLKKQGKIKTLRKGIYVST